mmetsp:Transcript_45302/g.68316  ORF Transcript_45302/g.68316 Transcript_45302/m.68316 type:complete len:107 (-) Transcript_45302:295-615(-)
MPWRMSLFPRFRVFWITLPGSLTSRSVRVRHLSLPLYLCYFTVSSCLLVSSNVSSDFTRLKLVQGKKEAEAAEYAKIAAAANKRDDQPENDITANFDAGDDEDVVF